MLQVSGDAAWGLNVHNGSLPSRPTDTSSGHTSSGPPFHLYCNGTSAVEVMAPPCPVLPTCVFWDRAAGQWNDQGCEWVQ